MALRNFLEYNEEMETFEKSKDYDGIYKILIDELYSRMKERIPVTAKALGETHGISEAKVRRVYRNAAMRGHAVVSTGNGFYMEEDVDICIREQKHIRQRAEAMWRRVAIQEQNLINRKKQRTMMDELEKAMPEQLAMAI